MTMCDRYDMEHPDAETTKMTRHFDNQTLPVDTNEQPACLSKVYRAVNGLHSHYTSNGEADTVHPSWSVAEKHEQGTLKWTPAEDGGHSILEKRTRPIELVPSESDHSEEELHDWDNPFWNEAEKQFYVMTPESVRKRKEFEKKMDSKKHMHIHEQETNPSEAEREKEMGIRDIIKEEISEPVDENFYAWAYDNQIEGCKEETPEPVDAEEFAKEFAKEYKKEHGLEQVRLRRETDPRLSAWERRKRVLDNLGNDRGVLKEFYRNIIEEYLELATNDGVMSCGIWDFDTSEPLRPSRNGNIKKWTDAEKDAALCELFNEYRELGYFVDVHATTTITPTNAVYGWKAGVTFNWGEDPIEETTKSDDEDDEFIIKEETIQWLDIKQIQPPKKMGLYLVLRKDVDTGEENVETCWWDRRYCTTDGNISAEWDFSNNEGYMRVIAWCNLPLRKRKGE